MNNNKQVFVIIPLMLTTLVLMGQTVHATNGPLTMSEADRYNSGYKHGVSDADQHLNQTCSLETHTVSFCDGYDAGYSARQDDMG